MLQGNQMTPAYLPGIGSTPSDLPKSSGDPFPGPKRARPDPHPIEPIVPFGPRVRTI
jgi:hypothetical protein